MTSRGRTCRKEPCDKPAVKSADGVWFGMYCKDHTRTRKLDSNGNWNGEFNPAPLGD